jgi:hypothetical protein
VTQIEFTVEALERDARGLIVCGRCCEADFGIGDTFTALRRLRYERSAETGYLQQVGSDIVATVELRVAEIGMYGRSVEQVPHAYTAGIRFTGSGLELLESLERSPMLVWVLVGERQAEPSAGATRSR